MARRQKGRAISGWLVVDKPAGLTSTTVVNRVRRAFDARKAGHAGTLDPAATGLLAIALGEATKTVPYVTDALKAYAFTIRPPGFYPYQATERVEEGQQLSVDYYVRRHRRAVDPQLGALLHLHRHRHLEGLEVPAVLARRLEAQGAESLHQPVAGGDDPRRAHAAAVPGVVGQPGDVGE